MKRIMLKDENSGEVSEPVSIAQSTAFPQPAPKREQIKSDPGRPRELPRVHPPEFVSILGPSLQVGLGAGFAGVVAGGAFGIIRSAPPVLFAVASGAQWFTLGSSYCAARLAAMRYYGGDSRALSSSEMIKSSAIGGGFAGTMGGLLRGPKNIFPAFVVCSLLGASGQVVANAYGRRQASLEASEPSKGFLHSKWSPLKPLSDEEYKNILEEKLLRVEADIAIVDDHIKELRDEKRTQQEKPNDT